MAIGHSRYGNVIIWPQFIDEKIALTLKPYIDVK